MKRKRDKRIVIDALPRGADLALNADAIERCEHCGASKHLHPILNPRFPKKEPNRQYLCALDYTERPATPLPFGLRELSDEDKQEWQKYWNRRD